ncbi:GntR family transcriptional regulator [Lachnospiraceae bacterium 48-42]|nr:GntR family transcriptional regulator [Dorea sp.]
MIIIDYNDKRPIYEQIVERFQTLIVSGVLEAGEKMPSVRTLAVELSINPNTIQRAYTELERDGFIYAVKGRGNFVKRDTELFEKQKERLLAGFEKQIRVCLRQGVKKEMLFQRLQEVAADFYGEVTA